LERSSSSVDEEASTLPVKLVMPFHEANGLAGVKRLPPTNDVGSPSRCGPMTPTSSSHPPLNRVNGV